MGAGAGGNFGNTLGSRLDALSDALSLASLVPGLDTFTDLASIPVDLARRDFLSAGLDLLGVVPVIGKIGDTAKLARVADKAIDAAKTAKTMSSVADNAKSVAKKYNLSKSGLFGEAGKNCRVFKSSNPVKSSADFYKKISKGGVEDILSNGKGVRTTFSDKSRTIYRIITKTPNSPAVEITITAPGKIKSQKIHFIKE